MSTDSVGTCSFAGKRNDSKSAELANRRSGSGVWLNGYDAVRNMLRDRSTEQAGFNAEYIRAAKSIVRLPILYLSGEEHRNQRGATARFFTPKMVNTRYKDLMENATDRLITRLRNAGHADLDSLSLELAVTVAADVIGLTESPVEGMMQRLESFFKPMPSASSSRLEKVTYSLLGNFRTLRFLFQDVRPAIASRRKQRREDVISHLLDEGYTQFEVLTECVTYAAAGMITTREFITMAGWHLLERPDLAAKFLRFRGQRVSRV